MHKLRICLGKKLSLSKKVKCIDLKYDWKGFSSDEKALLLEADKVYFPTIHFCHLFHALKRPIFPSINSYELLGDKIKQTLLFRALEIPHPETSFFLGGDKREKILSKFNFPFIAKIPINSSRGQGVFLIKDIKGLEDYLSKTTVAYIQEYIKIDRDIRVVILGKEVVLSYWKKAQKGEFRTNVAKGAEISFRGVPDDAIDLCLFISKRAGIDHAGFDVIMTKKGPLLLEVNIHFGKEGFRERGLSYKEILARLADAEKI